MTDADLKYLKKALGLDLKTKKWPGTNALPLYLKSGLQILIAETRGIRFLIARPAQEATLPDLKRLHAQLAKRVDIPVVISSPAINSRQRNALVSHDIPFVCAGKQAFLPFLGAASTEWGKAKLEVKQKAKLTPKAQQAVIWGTIINRGYTLDELRKSTGMSASQASSATSELVDRGLAGRSKNGRIVTIVPIGKNELLERHMGCLSSPVLRTAYTRRCPLVEALPNAGESALAECTALNPPPVPQKATSRANVRDIESIEILYGELSNQETVQVQMWRYSPLFADSSQIDAISLALSLADVDDERIAGELFSLFGKELPWQKAL